MRKIVVAFLHIKRKTWKSIVLHPSHDLIKLKFEFNNKSKEQKCFLLTSELLLSAVATTVYCFQLSFLGQHDIS